jgi:NADH-quinone oxidoreductase subunit G
VTDPVARAEIERAWGVQVRSRPGRDTAEILAGLAAGKLNGLVVGGVELADLPDPQQAERAIRRARFVVSLEMRTSAVTRLADVVLPVAAAAEKAGSYLNWEGRRREFATTLRSGSSAAQGTMPDCRVLDSLAVEMDADLFTQTPAAAAADLTALGRYSGARPAGPQVTAPPVPQPDAGKALLATWRRLLDNGSLQGDEPHLAGTARPPVALLSEVTAKECGARVGGNVRVSTDRGSITLPVATADLPDGVVWIPGNSGPATVRHSLAAGHGAEVSLTASVGAPGSTGSAGGTNTTWASNQWGGRA